MTKVSSCFPPLPHPLSLNANVDVPQSIPLAAAPLKSHVYWVSLTLRHPETRGLLLMCDVRTAENGKRNPHPRSGFFVAAAAVVLPRVHPFLTFPLASSACPGTLKMPNPSLQGSPTTAAFPNFSRCLSHCHFSLDTATSSLFSRRCLSCLFVFPFCPSSDSTSALA